ncbi:MAG: peptidoglycan-binding protein [Alphaproteobacteria bacterium]|nr:peptidoglycan-binding protein [Alphaproteobacteria bacterium]
MTLLAPLYALFMVLYAGNASTGGATVVSQHVGDFATMEACEAAAQQAKALGPAKPTPGFICVQKADLEAEPRRAEADEAALNLSEADRKRAQLALTALGYDINPATGVFGPRTRGAIAVWQKKLGQPETGYLTAAQWAVLQQQATAPAKPEEPRRPEADKPKPSADPRQAEADEAALRLSEVDRKRAQVALTALGHTIGAATGYFGPRTRAMITAWQKKQGLPETGFLSAEQWATLQQQAAPALAKYDAEQGR